MSDELARLMQEIRQAAGWEDEGAARAMARVLARMDPARVTEAMIGLLLELDGVDLSDDAGDVRDELFRTRRAVEAGLEACGAAAVERLVPLAQGLPTAAEEARAGAVALRVLARLGEQRALPVAEALARDVGATLSARLAAIEALGLLRPPDAAARLCDVLARPGGVNQHLVKRTAAHALGRVGEVQALEVLLDDADWYARLGAVEGLKLLPPDVSAPALARARADADERVRHAASEPAGA